MFGINPPTALSPPHQEPGVEPRRNPSCAADQRPSFYLDDIHRADFVAVTAPTSPPVFSINNCSDVRILISRAAPDFTLP